MHVEIRLSGKRMLSRKLNEVRTSKRLIGGLMACRTGLWVHFGGDGTWTDDWRNWVGGWIEQTTAADDWDSSAAMFAQSPAIAMTLATTAGPPA